MADYLASIKLRLYDDSALLLYDRRNKLEVFLSSIGITSDVAADLFEALLLSKSREIPLTTSQLREGIVRLRNSKKLEDPEFGLTDRNIQIWLKNFQSIGLIEVSNGRHRFHGNRTPSKTFKRTRHIVDESLNMSEKILLDLEKAYGIK